MTPTKNNGSGVLVVPDELPARTDEDDDAFTAEILAAMAEPLDPTGPPSCVWPLGGADA